MVWCLIVFNRDRKGLSNRLVCNTGFYQSRAFVADNTPHRYKPVLRSNQYDKPFNIMSILISCAQFSLFLIYHKKRIIVLNHPKIMSLLLQQSLVGGKRGRVLFIFPPFCPVSDLISGATLRQSNFVIYSNHIVRS